jgi:hypothetical protein
MHVCKCVCVSQFVLSSLLLCVCGGVYVCVCVFVCVCECVCVMYS